MPLLATIGTIAALAGTAASTGMSIGQSVRQKRLQKEADAQAAKSMAEARKRLDVNVYESLGIPKEVYELERDALLQQGQLALQAGMEGSQRGAAATAGRVQLAQQRGQAGVRSQMAKELYGLEKMTAAEESRLRDAEMSLDLAEAEGAQMASAQAEQARQNALQSTAAGVQQLGFQAMQLAPLYEKTAAARQTNKLLDQSARGGDTFEQMKAKVASQGIVNGIDYGSVSAMDEMQFKDFMGKQNPQFIKQFTQSQYGTTLNPFDPIYVQGLSSTQSFMDDIQGTTSNESLIRRMTPLQTMYPFN
mgnify:CR=1 FL=1